MGQKMSSTLSASSFVGVWQRESLSVENGAAYEDSNVLWVHAGDYFADLRWPKTGANQVQISAFAGRATWNAPRMHFDHEVDLTKEFAQDVGNLCFSEGKLIEKGQVMVEDKAIRFEETWVRLTTPDETTCLVVRKSESAGAGYLVRVGNYAIAMEETDTGFNAGAWKYSAQAWRCLYGLGNPDNLAFLLTSFTNKTAPLNWQVLI